MTAPIKHNESQKRAYMRQALVQATQGLGRCAPNPAVGAVLVIGEQVLAAGYHHGPGTGHAEVMALAQVPDGSDLSTATLYVTLEPCCHYGRTPPCTELILKRGIGQVVYGSSDPNPQVAGQGAQQLATAGVKVEQYCPPEVTAFNAAYTHWWRSGESSLVAKLAQSLDGKIAAADGQPLPITGDAAKCYTHQQRLQHDAILTTARTVCRDDPAFNVRLPGQAVVAKPVVVLDKQLSLASKQLKLFKTAAPLIIAYAPASDPQQSAQQAERLSVLRAAGAQCEAIGMAGGEKGDDEVCHDDFRWSAVRTFLGQQGFHCVWLEAGAVCLTRALQAQALSRCLLYVSPQLLGENAYPGLHVPGLLQQAQAISWQSLGEDGLCQIDF